MTDFDILKSHIGHKVVVVGYGQDKIVNVSIECEDCNEVLYSIEKEATLKGFLFAIPE